MMFSSEKIKELSREVGFDLCGVTAIDSFPELAALDDWVASGYAGEMRYLERTAVRRRDVRKLMPSARAVISLGTLYNTNRPYSIEITDPERAKISRYAWGEDYHNVLKGRMDTLLARLRDEIDVDFEARSYVDTGPVQERVYAQYAGLGWIGKNTCLIHPEQGSWFFLSEIITDLVLVPDVPQTDQCGTCTLCLDACPTDALRSPWVLDATRCLSYLTIELRGHIDEPFRGDLENHVYGCDICQEVCPYNAAPLYSSDAAWQSRPEFDDVSLEQLWERSDDELGPQLDNSAMSRSGLVGFRRNVAVSLGNQGAKVKASTFDTQSLSKDDSRRHPVVKDHVQWAKRRLLR